MSSLQNPSQIYGMGRLLVPGYWPDAPWNQFRGKSDQEMGILAVQLAGIYEDDMCLGFCPEWLF
jgi:hypothetical protein